MDSHDGVIDILKSYFKMSRMCWIILNLHWPGFLKPVHLRKLFSKPILKDDLSNYRSARALASLPPATSRRNPFMPQQVKKQPHDKPAYKIWWGFQMTKKELEAKCFFYEGCCCWSRAVYRSGDWAATKWKPCQGYRGTGKGGQWWNLRLHLFLQVYQELQEKRRGFTFF